MTNLIGALTLVCRNVLEIELNKWKELQKKATFKANLCETHVLNKIQRW